MDCHYVYETREEHISTCPIYGKKSSYSERFVYSILKQANIKFTPQMEFDWLPIRYYDTHLPDYNPLTEIINFITTSTSSKQNKNTKSISLRHKSGTLTHII